MYLCVKVGAKLLAFEDDAFIQPAVSGGARVFRDFIRNNVGVIRHFDFPAASSTGHDKGFSDVCADRYYRGFIASFYRAVSVVSDAQPELGGCVSAS